MNKDFLHIVTDENVPPVFPVTEDMPVVEPKADNVIPMSNHKDAPIMLTHDAFMSKATEASAADVKEKAPVAILLLNGLMTAELSRRLFGEPNSRKDSVTINESDFMQAVAAVSEKLEKDGLNPIACLGATLHAFKLASLIFRAEAANE